MKKQYLNIAEKASDLERQRNWLAASKHWQNAVSIAPAGSRDRAWAIARLEFCCHREGIKTPAY
ncbi:ANR family transcriptional regulator [Vibrio campbellii]|uniref:ANR family transcriptional regulator n=1 Tax=Vibrio campbellii TaxID=680 RepID=UPI000CD3707C|nr:ANR family transcriptional regulator [Vibrio campbellii]AUW07629.1 hypothetical protein C1N51_28840 [Vibrio campbellii]